MTLYFDIDAGIFVSGPGTRDRIDTLSFKRGDTCRIDLRFVSGITVQELAAGATGQIGLKESGEYDADFVAAAPSWTKTGTGTSTVYSFDLNLATTELNALLGDDGTEGNDVASVDLMFELEYVEDGITTSSPTLTATVYNDVIKGDESGPADITEGTPVNQVEATGTITFTGGGITSYTVTVGTETFTTTTGVSWTATGAASALVSEINAESAFIQASNVSGVVTITGDLQGAAANSFAISASVVGGTGAASTSGATMSGGVTATPGRAGTMKVDDDYLYVVSSVTSAVPLWKKIALSAL